MLSQQKEIKIALISPPTELFLKDAKTQNINYGLFPHTGLALVAEYTKHMLQKLLGDAYKITVKTFDGSFHTKEDIIQQVNNFAPDVCGFSLLSQTVKQGNEIAQELQKTLTDCVFVAGNDFTRFYPEHLVSEPQPYSYAITSDRGEVGFAQLIHAL